MGVDPRERLAEYGDPARGRKEESGRGIEEGGFAAARRPHDGDEGARRNGEADVAHHRMDGARRRREAHRNRLEGDRRRLCLSAGHDSAGARNCRRRSPQRVGTPNFAAAFSA